MKKPVAYALTKKSPSDNWTHSLASLADAKYVAKCDCGKKLNWSAGPEYVSEEYKSAAYTIRPIFALTVGEAIKALPSKQKAPKA